jgi:hypothetical protein
LCALKKAHALLQEEHKLLTKKSGGFLFVWTLFALSTTGWVTMILSAHGLWTTFRSRPTAQLASTSGMPAADH